jgi:cellobiose epimerase
MKFPNWMTAAAAVWIITGCVRPAEAPDGRDIERELRDRFLAAWYPRAVDRQCGGFLSTFDAGWNPTGPQDKNIVIQSRHLWTTSIAARFFPADSVLFRKAADQGFEFIRAKMWDPEKGGFFQVRDRTGGHCPESGYGGEKRAYGNAFGIFACVAYYRLTGDRAALALGQTDFRWLDAGSRDPVHGGYFQNLDRAGSPVPAGASGSRAFDAGTAGLKDYNSSIHLLEAFTALYRVWPDSVLKSRLEEMALLIRDRMTDPRGFLNLYFRPDWTPISYRDSTDSVRNGHRYEDHVSFGHDMETAYLLLEANDALGGVLGDSVTLNYAMNMLNHSLKNGWDSKNGGFYESGYYFQGKARLTLTDDSKSWWVQAEALHVLALMSVKVPENRSYREAYRKQWSYMKRYLFDEKRGGWYEMGLDTRPEYREKPKGHEWKSTYHETRSLLLCLQILDNRRFPGTL